MTPQDAYDKLKHLPQFLETTIEKLPEVGTGFFEVKQKVLYNTVNGSMVYQTKDKISEGILAPTHYDDNNKGLIVSFQIGSYSTYAQAAVLPPGEAVANYVKCMEGQAKLLGLQ